MSVNIGVSPLATTPPLVIPPFGDGTPPHDRDTPEEGGGDGTPPHDDGGDRDTPEEGADRDTPEEGGGEAIPRGKKRHRRAKGKKKKQKTCLMITNEDGTDSTTQNDLNQGKKVYLRPSNNPLLKAPKNSTQFIIDDHENSNLFWNFDAHETTEQIDGELEEDKQPNQGMAVMPGQFFGTDDCDRFSPDDDTFWNEYSERDFESVYETAHQEEIYSWEKAKIIEEINLLELKQKQLINMLSQIDPLIYLEKLQHELLSLQEQNRKLKLINIAERHERQKRGGRSATSSPRLPDSTTKRGEEVIISGGDSESEDSTSEDSDDDDEGGCSSGCCLAESCLEDNRLDEVDSETDDQVKLDGQEQMDDHELLDTQEKLVDKEQFDNQEVVHNMDNNIEDGNEGKQTSSSDNKEINDEEVKVDKDNERK